MGWHAPVAAAESNKVARIAVLAHRGEAAAYAQWGPTADYLARHLPGYSFRIIPVTNDNIGTAIAEGGAEFVLTNPASYAGLELRYGITRIATVLNRRQGGIYKQYGAVIFTRADRNDIRGLASLRGKRFMAVHPNAFGGWWMAWQALKEQGIDPGRDFSRLAFSGFPQDRVVEAVAEGRVDAGTVRTDILERMAQEGKIDLARFKVLGSRQDPGFPFLHSTRLYAEWPFAVSSHTPEQLAVRVAIALLSMPADSPAARAAHIAGWATPLDYQPVHKLMKSLRVGPYNHFNEVTFFQALKQMWPWLLGLAVVVLSLTTGYFLRFNRVLSRSRESMAKVLYSIGDGVITTDARGFVDYFNPVAERLIGLIEKEVRGRHYLAVLNLVDAATGEPLDDLVQLSLEQPGAPVHADNGLLTHRDGREYAIKVTASPMRNGSQEVIGAVLVLHDLTEVMGMARQLTYQATHDMLTGLVNRAEFEIRLERAIKNARAEGQQHALLYMDLDQFKVVNDTCGHRAGDELLRQLTSLLLVKIRDSDTLARLGGDEFGLLLSGCSLDWARNIAEEMRQMVKDFRFVWQEKTFGVGVSIGVVPITAGSGKLADVLSAADSACYVAKDHGRNLVHVYEPNDRAVARRHGEMEWVHRITDAFEDGRFLLYCQSIEMLSEPDSGVAHYEVLMRMADEEGDTVPPMAFIPAAERYNLMPTLDRWVVRTTFGKLREAQGPAERPPINCAINLSGQSLCDRHFLGFVVEQFEESGIPCDCICFEITETSAIANLSAAMRFISVLKGMGSTFALDDFGSGVSSFGYLKNLKVDYLKIDGGFVKDMAEDSVDHAMVESINQIGHVMGLKTIAEFAESSAVIEHLRELGVDCVQGYAVGRPEPLDAVLARLAVRKSVSRSA